MPDATVIDPKTFLREHCTLPALPEVVSRIQEKILDDNANTNEIAGLIERDASILAQVLKVVNSAYYGLPSEITKVRMAVAYLGLHEVYRMIISLSVVNTLGIKEKKELDAFRFHTFFTARCAKHLAKQHEPLLSHEDLWPAAMLHDIGKLVYLKFFPDDYKKIKMYAAEQGVTFNQGERHFGLAESSYFGTLLCDHWRLPSQAKLGCEHHTLEDVANSDGNLKPIQRIVGLANLLAILSTDDLNQDTKGRVVETISKKLNLNQESFLALMGDIYQIKEEVEEFVRKF